MRSRAAFLNTCDEAESRTDMTELLPNFVGGRWLMGQGAGIALVDPVLGSELVRVDRSGIDLASAFDFSRRKGGAALRALTYQARAEMLGAIAKCLQSRREDYFEIACANSGTVRSDSAIDIDGAIYTLSQYAKMGAALGSVRHLPDGDRVSLAKDGSFVSQHVRSPTHGVALFINAFNFPAWGLWEKAAPALLSGVPIIIKPATATAWLTQRMVHDVIAAGILPAGALSVICGGFHGLLDALEPFDVVSFTGSADTAAVIRSHAAIAERSVRVNIEADSLNSALLMPGTGATSVAFDLLVSEVIREMSVKSGQKCTAIRRVLVPLARYDDMAQALAERLKPLRVGNPRRPEVQMGSLVSGAQKDAVREGTATLRREASMLYDGSRHDLIDADAGHSAVIAPTLLGVRDPDFATQVHELEVFGPVSTLMPYRDLAHAASLVRRGQGSLVLSLFGEADAAISRLALELAESHGRVHVVTPDAADSHTGHGNVVPASLHGGPGRAGGGEELGGLRALDFYHRRSAIQASPAVLAHWEARND
jgi:3,4-dehydroadipyl-CoA semialdehyde dehydrogenase